MRASNAAVQASGALTGLSQGGEPRARSRHLRLEVANHCRRDSYAPNPEFSLRSQRVGNRDLRIGPSISVGNGPSIQQEICGSLRVYD
jgi:hypothetical protein